MKLPYQAAPSDLQIAHDASAETTALGGASPRTPPTPARGCKKFASVVRVTLQPTSAARLTDPLARLMRG
eukprot:13567063-Alexandrium_andersonii.AAC.1